LGFKVIDVGTAGKLVSSACYDNMSVPCATVFTLDEPIAVKLRLFTAGYPCLTPSFEGNPLTQRHENLSQKTSPCGSPQWRFHDPKLRRSDTIQQCDRQTDGQTDASAVAKTRLALHAVAHNKIIYINHLKTKNNIGNVRLCETVLNKTGLGKLIKGCLNIYKLQEMITKF